MFYNLVWIETHKQHLELLKNLKYDTKYIYLYVGCPLNDEHKDYILEYCNNNLNFVKKEPVDKLFGDNTATDNHTQYVFSIENYNDREQLFDFFSTFETFFHREVLLNKNKHYQNRCDFGLDDIGFVDANGEVLCYTITHEAMTYVKQ